MPIRDQPHNGSILIAIVLTEIVGLTSQWTAIIDASKAMDQQVRERLVLLARQPVLEFGGVAHVDHCQRKARNWSAPATVGVQTNPVLATGISSRTVEAAQASGYLHRLPADLRQTANRLHR